MAAIIYKPPHETQRLWKRQEKFKASWKPLVTSQGEALGTRGYKCFYYLSLGAGYRVTIDLWRFTDSCILLDAYYFTETECLTSSRYFLTWNISVCMRGRRRTGGERWREGERTAGGGGRRWQGQWGWLGPDLRESWLHLPSSTTTKSPDPAAKMMLSKN